MESEAAALALAAFVNDFLNFDNTSFLSDSQQLVQFLNATGQSSPHNWRIKYSKVYYISRNLNTTNDSLAKQAFSISHTIPWTAHVMPMFISAP
jgi:ribonuclease HI